VGTPIGVLKAAANRLGLSVEEYTQKKERGEKWCSGCKDWHPKNKFPRDRARSDGLRCWCLLSSRRQPRGYRDPQKELARRVVSLGVKTGALAHPSSIPCADCGHLADDRRHEYDHFAGYDFRNWTSVEAVCTLCHADREIRRRGSAECRDTNSKNHITALDSVGLGST
jgi:hypothetical protein